MTPTQLIDNLKLPHDHINRIKALKASLTEFDAILRGAKPEDECDDTPFHKFMLQQVQNCVNLIAQILKEDSNTVQQALLALFSITEVELTTTSFQTFQIIALSKLLEAKQK
jgi:hypothetical protein